MDEFTSEQKDVVPNDYTQFMVQGKHKKSPQNLESEDYINLMKFITTDQYKPCWVELEDNEEQKKQKIDSNKIESKTKNEDVLNTFYGKYDSDKTPKEEMEKLDELYRQKQLTNEQIV